MKTTALPLRFAAVLPLATASALSAAEFLAEGFDSEATARVQQNNGTAGLVEFVDYANFTVGAVSHSIPEAPRKLPGSADRKGVLMRVLYDDGAVPPTATSANDRHVNLVAVDAPGGLPLNLANNYRLKFDAYLSLSPAVTIGATGIPTQAGTTEHFLWGVGYTSGLPLARNWRTARGRGMWGWLATEGGNGATNGSDASLWAGPSLVGGRNMDTVAAVTDVATYFAPAFGADATPVPNCPANQWVMADITVRGGQVTVQYQAVGRTAVRFFENVNPPTLDSLAGTVMVGYEDSFGSASFDPARQWVLIDNMVVEDLTPPTMTVTPAVPLATFTGQPVIFSYTVSNARTDAPLTISAVNFSGTSATAFSVVSPLPLTIPAGQFAQLELAFSPAAPNGVKTADMTIVSNDPQTPNFVVTGLAARRSVGTFLAAHYKLDEASGVTFADASGNGFPGGAQVRDPILFGQPGLIGAAGGTAMGFARAQSGTTGNYFTSNVTHTPSYTISMWIRPGDVAGTRTLFQRDPDFDAAYEEICGLLLDASNRLVYRVAGAEVLNSDNFVEGLVAGTAYHVVVTHLDTDGFGNATAQRARLYINGRLIAEKVDAEAPGFDDYPLNPTVGALHFATRTVAGSGYLGDMDDVQVYGTELSKEQVWELFSGPGRVASPEWGVSALARMEAPAAFSVSFPSSPDGTYQLFRSTQLSAGWAPVGAALTGSNAASSTLTDPAPPAGNAFYRVQRQ